MPPPVCQQVITALKIIMGEDGTDDGTGMAALRSNVPWSFILNGRTAWPCRGANGALVLTGRRRIEQLADNSLFFRNECVPQFACIGPRSLACAANPIGPSASGLRRDGGGMCISAGSRSLVL